MSLLIKTNAALEKRGHSDSYQRHLEDNDHDRKYLDHKDQH